MRLTVDSQKYRAKTKGVETIGDECSQVGLSLSQLQARRNLLNELKR